jgi:hypothetical protein
VTAALVLAALLAVAAVVLVARPFLREPVAADDRLDAPDARELRRLELAEERDRALGALKELEFDHRTGKITDEDYRELVGPLRRRAGEALRALDERAGDAGMTNGKPQTVLLEPPEPGPQEPYPPDVPEPYPPPDEGTPPTPAPVPEPYPPPDEGTPPRQP